MYQIIRSRVLWPSKEASGKRRFFLCMICKENFRGKALQADPQLETAIASSDLVCGPWYWSLEFDILYNGSVTEGVCTFVKTWNQIDVWYVHDGESMIIDRNHAYFLKIAEIGPFGLGGYDQVVLTDVDYSLKLKLTLVYTGTIGKLTNWSTDRQNIYFTFSIPSYCRAPHITCQNNGWSTEWSYCRCSVMAQEVLIRSVTVPRPLTWHDLSHPDLQSHPVRCRIYRDVDVGMWNWWFFRDSDCS